MEPKQSVHQAVCEQCQKEQGDEHQQAHDDEEHDQEDPALDGVLAGLVEGSSKQGVVAAVGTPGNVESVAKQRNGADDDLDDHIGHHTGEDDVRNTAHPRGEDDEAGGDAAQDVSDAGDQADDSVQSKADGSSGDADEVVQEVGEDVQILVIEDPAASTGAGGEDIGLRGRLHRGSSKAAFPVFDK